MNSSSQQKELLSVFAWVDKQHEQVQATLHTMANAPSKAMASRCMYLAHKTQKVCAQNSTSLLAALQLNRQTQYRHIKELFTAVLAELIAKQLNVPSAKRLMIVCAALTQDISIIGLQDETLDKQQIPLNEEQQRLIFQHPRSGRLLLEKAQVKDFLWLETVEQHHEQPDGTGYPQNLKEESICLGARILRVADAYVAMTRARGDRPAFVPKDAIKEIFLQREEKFDTLVARTLNTVLGMYPPGIWVTLANNEVGVVSDHGSTPPCPFVSVVIGADGAHLNEALLRDTTDHRFTIIETMLAPFHFNLTSVLNTVWPEIKE